MRNFLSISFLLVFVYIQLFNGFVWLTYEINKSEIIERFCVNKEKPEMKCEGTCHMKKMMLDNDSEKERKPQTLLPELLLFAGFEDVQLELRQTETQLEILYFDLYRFNFLSDWELPPKA